MSCLMGSDAQISLIPHPWEAKGESRFFCAVDVDEEISVSQLLEKEVKEYTRGNFKHFYVSDVIQAAVSANQLEGNQFFLYHKW